MEALIFGAGAVGLGLGSALLAAGARVRFVGREDTVRALRAHGLVRTGLFGRVEAAPGRFQAAASIESLTGPAVEFALVATKSFDSEQAARALANQPQVVGGETHVVLCQNGWGNAEHFAGRFPAPRLWNARVITGFRRDAPHRVEITVHAEPIHVGSLHGVDPAPLLPLCEAVARGGIPCRTTERIAEDLWAKMLYNGLLNPLGALFQVPYGELGRSPHARAIMAELAAETFAVMRAAGYRTHWEGSESYLRALYERLLPPTESHESSMLQDLRAGRRTEIDALTGEIVRLGSTHGVATPVSHTLLAMIRFMEAPRARHQGRLSSGAAPKR